MLSICNPGRARTRLTCPPGRGPCTIAPDKNTCCNCATLKGRTPVGHALQVVVPVQVLKRVLQPSGSRQPHMLLPASALSTTHQFDMHAQRRAARSSLGGPGQGQRNSKALSPNLIGVPQAGKKMPDCKGQFTSGTRRFDTNPSTLNINRQVPVTWTTTMSTSDSSTFQPSSRNSRMILNLSALMAWLSPVPACALSTCGAAPGVGHRQGPQAQGRYVRTLKS